MIIHGALCRSRGRSSPGLGASPGRAERFGSVSRDQSAPVNGPDNSTFIRGQALILTHEQAFPQTARAYVRSSSAPMRTHPSRSSKASHNSRTVKTCPGNTNRGAISAHGASTNARRCARGWGRLRAAE